MSAKLQIYNTTYILPPPAVIPDSIWNLYKMLIYIALGIPDQVWDDAIC